MTAVYTDEPALVSGCRDCADSAQERRRLGGSPSGGSPGCGAGHRIPDQAAIYPGGVGWEGGGGRVGVLHVPRGGPPAAEKNALKPCQKKEWCIPKVSAEFVAHMEDVLDLYAEPYDPKRPVVCFDETSTQLLAEARAPMPPRPGRPQQKGHIRVARFASSRRPWTPTTIR